MQGFERMEPELLDAAGLDGHPVREGRTFAFLAGLGAQLFPDALCGPVCLARGPAVDPGHVHGSVTTLQTLHDFSDRDAAEAVRFYVRGRSRLAPRWRMMVLSLHAGVPRQRSPGQAVRTGSDAVKKVVGRPGS